jgi:hypothetical protein
MKRRDFIGGLTASSLAVFSTKAGFDYFRKKSDVKEIKNYVNHNMEGYNSQIDSESPYQENADINVLVDSQYNILTGSDISIDIALEGHPREDKDIDISEPAKALELLEEDIGYSYVDELHEYVQGNLDNDVVEIDNIALMVQDPLERKSEPYTYAAWQPYDGDTVQDWCRVEDENILGEVKSVREWAILQE